MLDPVAVALKFGFLAILYLFLIWMVRSSLRDLRRVDPPRRLDDDEPPPVQQGTGVWSAASGLEAGANGNASGRHLLRVERGGGLAEGSAYDLADGAVVGRGDHADIRLTDSYASSRHARLSPHGELLVLEDLGSTNGTYLNGEPLEGAQPLHPGDRIRIGDAEFSYER